MLINLIFSGPDFTKSLRQRRRAALAFLSVGLVGIVCYFLLVPGSGLDDHAQGFYLGAASGICLGAVVLLVRTQYLFTHPAAMKAAKIQETDEREVSIKSSAFQFAGFFTFFASAAALFVVLPLSRAAFAALLAVMAVYALAFLAALAWFRKKL